MLKSNARILCASNCSLRERVRHGKFREDLFQRLNGLTLLIPPLRERLEELPALIAAELKIAAAKEGKDINAIHPEAMEKLLHHPWPGNLRELSHTVRTMALFCDGPVIFPHHVIFPPDLDSSNAGSAVKSLPNGLSEHTPARDDMDLSLASAVKRHVHFVYQQANRNQRRTAKLLGISRATLARHLRNSAQNQSTGLAQS
jgi:DNA-binding NtrC family response regulator